MTDNAAAAITAIAKDLAPAFHDLVSDPATNFIGLAAALGGACARHPREADFVDALLADPQMAAAFEYRGDDTITGTSERLAMTTLRSKLLSTGMMLCQQISVVAGALLGSAAVRCLVDDDLSEDHFTSHAQAVLDQFRALVRGESIVVPFILVMSGIDASAERELPTPWGTVRRLRDLERHICFVQPPDDALVLHGEVEIHVIATDDPSEYVRRHGLSTHDIVTETARKLALAFALGISRDPPAGVGVSWWVVLSPLMGAMTMPGHRSGLVARHTLTSTDELAFQGIAPLIQERYHPGIDLAVRRCLSALGERTDPTDTLIDAMIAIEGLLGTRDPGLSFQLAASLALLLGETADARNAIYGQMKKLYDVRSKVVHGRSSSGSVDVAGAAAATAKLALNALRVLLLDRPELLTGDDRAKRIVLGADVLTREA